MTLAEIKVGQDAVLRTIGGQGELRHHLLDMGLTPGTEVTLRKVAPMGDPIEVELRGYELTLRLADAAKIEVDNVHETDRAARSETRHAPVPHPGVGELRKAASYHDRKAGSEIRQRTAAPFRPGRQPELRQNDAVQPADRLQPACGQLSRASR